MSTPIPVNYISVTACDNELYIVAAPSNGSMSTELCHIMSGYNQPVSYAIYPGAVLSATLNPYNLYIIGLNWGAQSDFNVGIGQTGQPLTVFSNNDPSAVGVWSATASITVSAP